MNGDRMLRSSGLVASLMLLLLAGEAAIAQDAQKRFNGALLGTVGWQDNIGLASQSEDKFDVMTTELELFLGYKLVQQQGLELEIAATPFYEYVSDVSDLSNYGAEFGIELLGEFGPDFTAPWYSLSLDYTLIEFRDSEPRDGSWLEFEGAIGKRFSPLFGLSGGYRYFRRWQDNKDPLCIVEPGREPGAGGCGVWITSDVFDHERHGGFAHLDFFFGDRTNLFFEYTFWKGDVASTGRAARPGAVVTSDLAFGTFVRGNGSRRFYRVWRSDADQHVTELALNRSFGENWNLELSAIYLWTSRVDSQSGTAVAPLDDDDYENALLSATLGFSF